MTLWVGGASGLVLTEAHNSNAATYTLTPLGGNDYPISFPDGTSSTIPATGISLTIPSGATLAVLNPYGFRLWFAVFNIAGVATLAVRKCSYHTIVTSVLNKVSFVSPPEYSAAPTVLLDGTADNPHVFYSSSATTGPWLWAAFATYESSLAVAGNWNLSPNSIYTITPSTPRPGAILQTQTDESVHTATFSTTGQSQVFATLDITPSSTANYVEAGIGWGYIQFAAVFNAGNASILFQNVPANRNVGAAQSFYTSGTNDQFLMPLSIHGYDAANSVATVTYRALAVINSLSGTTVFSISDLYIKEVMG